MLSRNLPLEVRVAARPPGDRREGRSRASRPPRSFSPAAWPSRTIMPRLLLYSVLRTLSALHKPPFPLAKLILFECVALLCKWPLID